MANKLRNTKSGSKSFSSKKPPKRRSLVQRRNYARPKNQPPNLSRRKLPSRSQEARDRALHVLAAMRRNPKLSLSRAAGGQKVKPSTVLKYFGSDLRKSAGQFGVTKRD